MLEKWSKIDIPQEVIDMIKKTLLDNLGVAIGATKYNCSKIISEFVKENFDGDESFIWSTGEKTSMLGACLANGITLDSLDMHDSSHNAKGHAGAAIIPCAISICGNLKKYNLEAMENKDFLKMLVIGYETAYRIGEIIDRSKDYSSSASWNIFGCCAMGCYRFKLNEEQTRNAFGIAEFYSPKSLVMGSMENPSMIKDGSGWGSFVGLYSVILAKKNFTCCPSIYYNKKDIWEDIGKKYHILEYHVFKKYPVCYWAQASINAILTIRDKVMDNIINIEKIEIHTFAEALSLGKNIPRTSDDVQYNIVYPVIETLIDGDFNFDSLTLKNLTNQKKDLINKTKILLHSKFLNSNINESKYHENCSQIKIILTDGNTIISDLCYVPWDTFRNQPEPTEKELNIKFINLCKEGNIKEAYYDHLMKILNDINYYKMDLFLDILKLAPINKSKL